jgi:purine-nucleoside phosphorylase
MREPEPQVEAAAGLLREQGLGGPFAYAIVTGTGLGALVRDLQEGISSPTPRVR